MSLSRSTISRSIGGFALVLLLSALPLRADTGLTADQILKQLNDLEKQHSAAQQGSLSSVLSEIVAAENDPQAALTLFQKAVFETQFDGAKGDSAAFQDWKKNHETVFHDPAFTGALSLHLRYLEMSITYAKSGDPAPLIDPLLNFIQDLWDFEAKNTAQTPSDGDKSTRASRRARALGTDLSQSLLTESISSGALAKYYQVDSLITALKNWESTPSNDESILTSTVFPALRAAKKPQLIQVWDLWIDHEAADSKDNPLADQQEHFQNETLPKLRWSRALDLLALDRKDDAMAEMLDIIKSFPLHPDNPSWITQLRAIASGQPLPSPTS